MPDGCENSRNTDVSNTYLLSKGIVIYVSAAGERPMFTMYMAGAGRPGTGGSITSSFDVFVGGATLMGMIKDEAKL
jgi:hypothetical protein